MDNASAHGTIDQLSNSSNFEVLFLPKNATSKLQALDAGVIAAVKRRYRTKAHVRLFRSTD